MKLENGIPDELLKKGYYLRLSDYHTFIITLELTKDRNVLATACEMDLSYLDVDISELKNGDEIECFQCLDENKWWLTMDIWGKYYFPKFNESNNQWYHKHYEGDHDYITDFCELVKGTYEIAMKESKLKIY